MGGFTQLLNDIIYNYIIEDFWFILFLALLIIYRRAWGMLIVTIQFFWGYHPLIFVIIAILGIILDSDYDYRKYYKFRFEYSDRNKELAQKSDEKADKKNKKKSNEEIKDEIIDG